MLSSGLWCALFKSLLLLTTFLSEPSDGFQITGATGGIDYTTGALPNRIEISKFATSGAAFDLYILALSALQAVDQRDSLSYFQVAGIHGYPIAPWDNVIGNGSEPGYCPHRAPIFPTWHRPYIALHEQLIWKHAQDIATTYPDDRRTEYVEAADSLRVPYWDWAINVDLPDVVQMPNIAITSPNGYEYVTNPLYAYEFQHGAAGNNFPLWHPLANFSTTVRHWDYQSQSSSQSAANTLLQTNAAWVLSSVFKLLSLNASYTDFASEYVHGALNGAINIENIHDSIHSNVGGPIGHMEDLGFAAFDPVFMLHHANVDRIFAMWQAINPDTYIVSDFDQYGTYYQAPYHNDTEYSPLAPFHSDSGSTMFTSRGVRSTRRFGYSYPELLNDRVFPQDYITASVKTAVNLLYNSHNNSTNHRIKSRKGRRSASVADSFGHVSLDLAQQLNVNNLDRQWAITISVDRFPIDTSFNLDFFLGEVPSDTSAWPTAPNLIGTYNHFIAANVSTMYADSLPGGQVQGEISMTHNLAAGVARGVLRDMSPASVTPLLRHSLSWRARTSGGEKIDLSALSGLKIAVHTRSVVPRNADDEFPTYGDVQWVASAGNTENKLCKWYDLDGISAS